MSFHGIPLFFVVLLHSLNGLKEQLSVRILRLLILLSLKLLRMWRRISHGPWLALTLVRRNELVLATRDTTVVVLRVVVPLVAPIALVIPLTTSLLLLI